jgi:hypothetical protein
MIHFLHLDETMPDPAAAPEPPPPPRAPRVPAAYYASPALPPPVFPRGVVFGCGSASIVFLVVLFVCAAYADRFMPAAFELMQSEIDGQFTKEVPAAQRAAFDKEFSTLIARMRQGKAKVAALRPFLEKMRDAGADEKFTPEETKALTDDLRKLNTKP